MRDNAYFLDLARERAGLPSDYRLARALGISRQMVSKLRAGAVPVSEPIADELGRLCRVEGVVIYAQTQAARAKRTEVRAFWERVARGWGVGASACVLAGALLAALPAPAGASVGALFDKVYILRSRWRRAWRRMRDRDTRGPPPWALPGARREAVA